MLNWRSESSESQVTTGFTLGISLPGRGMCHLSYLLALKSESKHTGRFLSKSTHTEVSAIVSMMILSS